MFIQPDWWEVDDPAVGTNRYAYSHNDPINLADPGGNAPDYGYGVANSYYTGSHEAADPSYGVGGGRDTIHVERIYIGRETRTVYHGIHDLQSFDNEAGRDFARRQIESLAQFPNGNVPAAIGGYLDGSLTLNQAMSVANTGSVQGGISGIGMVPRHGVPGASSSQIRGPIWSSTKKKTATENAFGHWKDHGKEFPEYSNATQYVQGAHRFVSNPPRGTQSRVRKNGETMYYDPSSNTFAVVGPDGAPKTMFRPSAGSSYWQGQLKKWK